MSTSIIEKLNQAKQQNTTAAADALSKNAAEIEKTQIQIRQGENYIKRLQQSAKKEIRNARTKRLIERGAILESAISDADKLTNNQIQQLVYAAFSSPAIVQMREQMHETVATE